MSPCLSGVGDRGQDMYLSSSELGNTFKIRPFQAELFALPKFKYVIINILSLGTRMVTLF